MNFGPFPDNTNLRGQADNGSCTTMFDTDCVNAIELAVQQYALDLVANPTPEPNSNLTQQSLPGVCNSIGEMLQSNIPQECTKYVNGSTQVGSRTGEESKPMVDCSQLTHSQVSRATTSPSCTPQAVPSETTTAHGTSSSATPSIITATPTHSSRRP